MSLNYDPDVDVAAASEAASEAAKANGDFDGRPDAFRDSARIWLPDETRPPARKSAVRESLPSEQKVGAQDLEAVEDMHHLNLLPRHRAQVHFEYTRSEERRVGKSVSGRVELGGGRVIKKKKLT